MDWWWWLGGGGFPPHPDRHPDFSTFFTALRREEKERRERDGVKRGREKEDEVDGMFA